MGVLAAFGRIGSIAGQFVFGALISVSVHALLAVAAVMLVIGTPFAFVLPRVARRARAVADACASRRSQAPARRCCCLTSRPTKRWRSALGMTRATTSSVPLPSATALGTSTMARAPGSLWLDIVHEPVLCKITTQFSPKRRANGCLPAGFPLVFRVVSMCW